MNDLLPVLQDSALATAMRTGPWAYPLVETVHLVAIATVFGTVLIVDLRVLGLGIRVAPAPLAAFALRINLAGFALAAVTGALLFASHAVDVAASIAFQFKLQLLIFLALNAAVFHLRGSLMRRDLLARLQAIGSIAGWIGVIAAGRLIADA
ncbi:membrane protein [soil metagenome]